MRESVKILCFVLCGALPQVVQGKEPASGNQYEDGVTLNITSKPFDPKAHTIQKCGDTVCVIDGRPVYGTYGKMPTQEVTSLIFSKNGKKIALDVSGMYNPNVNNANIRKYIKTAFLGRRDL